MRKFITIPVLAIAVSLIVAYSWSNLKKTAVAGNLIARFMQPNPTDTIPVPPPLEALGQGARLPTAQELEQEKKFNAQQIELAVQWLKNPDAHQRITGAEQLSAYKSPLSEQHLADTLRHDAVPEVRKTAAHSLSGFKTLSDHTVSDLINALDDADKSTRIATLNTLMAHAFLIRADTKKSGQLIGKLREKLRSGHLNNDVRDSLQAFIKDQEPPTNVFFAPLSSQTIQISN